MGCEAMHAGLALSDQERRWSPEEGTCGNVYGAPCIFGWGCRFPPLAASIEMAAS